MPNNPTAPAHQDTSLSLSSSELQALIWDTVRVLSRIDAEYHLQVTEVERRVADEAIKAHIRQKLRAAHRTRREPHVHRLDDLRQQQTVRGS